MEINTLPKSTSNIRPRNPLTNKAWKIEVFLTKGVVHKISQRNTLESTQVQMQHSDKKGNSFERKGRMGHGWPVVRIDTTNENHRKKIWRNSPSNKRA